MKFDNYGHWTCDECPTGQHQSPINVTGVVEAGTCGLTFNYRTLPLVAIDKGHTIQFDDDTHRDHVVYQGTSYELKQFHFHHPGEHTINGQTFAMELHLVHWHEDEGFLVVAVMITQGEEPNPAYETLCTHLPGGAEADTPDPLSLIALLPEDHHSHFNYGGSLTTPPCSENVYWVILEQPVALSQAQLDAFGALYTGNNRPLQDLNGRVIRHYS